MEEKRKHNRLELSGELLLNPIGGTGEAQQCHIDIHDCSTDGIGFTTDAQLTIGNNYEANLTLWNKDMVHVFIQIVRAGQDGDIYRYGGIFIGMPDADRMRIEVYETVKDTLEEQEK